MLNNPASPATLEILQSFESISRLLKDLERNLSNVDEIMSLLRSASGAGSAALYKRYYADHDKFDLQRLGFASTHADHSIHFPEMYSDKIIGPAAWGKLCSEKQCFVSIGPIDQAGNEKPGVDFFIYPLLFEGEPFGLFMFQDLKVTGDIESLTCFLASICNLFELWISRTNTQKLFDDVYNTFPNPSFIMATDEKITAWNQANETLTGWQADKVIGKEKYTSSLPYYDTPRPMMANLIMQPDPDWQSTYFEYSQEGNHINALAFCPSLPGGGAFLRAYTSRLFDVNNRLHGVVHTVRDVTLERQMKENLQRSETMYRAIADFAGVGILLVKDNEIIYSNEQVEEFIGKADGSLVFEDILSLVQTKDSESIKYLISKLPGEKEGPVRFAFQTERNNEVRHFNALAQSMTYENENVIHFVIDDISEQKELDRRARLNELKLFHEERLTSLGIMAAGIAHELNQPLNTIRVIADGFLYCDEKGWGMDRDEVKDNIEMISRQVLRMSSVIQNIRNFARDDQSEEFTDVCINEAIGTVFSMIGRQLEAHNIQVHQSLKKDLPPVMAPMNQLEQVVTNLLINARQAFDSCNKNDCNIWLETDLKDNAVYLEIGDNATGVPRELLKKIFYPFFTTKQVGRGTGLGLSICQSIIAGMKGKLDVYNNSRGGATFVVSIPLQEMRHEYSRN